MANEEQRRAFASYMGTANASAGQQAPQSSGGFPSSEVYLSILRASSRRYCTNNCACSRFKQQFPGIQGGLPTAPTPPPAAPSSVASYPSYQGNFRPGYPQGAYGQGGYQLNGYPQRPPPLGQSQAIQGQQLTQPQAGPPGYVQVQRNFSNQPPTAGSYDAGWQYTDPMVQQNTRLNGEPASRIAMVPSARNFSGEIVQSGSKHTSERYQYQQYGHLPPGGQASPPEIEEQTVPVLLCHTCSVCSRMRSARYHRHNPVVPGKPLVLTPCHRCKKKLKKEQRSMSSYTRIRSCTADEPCDWPRESVRIDIDHAERRGRRRDREEVRVYRYFPSRPRIIRQSTSQTRLGLRVLQQEDRPPRMMREARIRVSSLSPRRASRYDEIWPPPDVVPTKLSRSGEALSLSRINPNFASQDAVWPPPDVVPTHSHRKVAASPPRRPSSRIIELTPSPPPARNRTTRMAYRSESRERHVDSPLTKRASFREERQTEEAEERVMSHPRPYRSILPEHRNFTSISDEISSTDYMPRGHPDSPGRSILKPSGGDRETSRRRMSMRESQQSTTVEVGGPRVHFTSERKSEGEPPELRGGESHREEIRRFSEEYDHYRDYSHHRYVDDQLAPPAEDMERLRIRRSPPSPQRSYEEEIRIDRARRISPSPPRRYDEIRVRHVSPLPPRERGRPAHVTSSPERPAYSGYRHVERAQAVSRTRSISPPRIQRPVSEDMTESDSAHSGEVTEVRKWRGIDENGQPATFVEERRTVRMLEQGSERGTASEFRPLNERLGSRSWRDV
ncbi:hypothetical protein BKA63DRAFT_552629 [Paraphoma chrysanthemicola]|nr:hypothetical protein BKA63DRAFT_552629 [Paraphoma chrysanthemicola]